MPSLSYVWIRLTPLDTRSGLPNHRSSSSRLIVGPTVFPLMTTPFWLQVTDTRRGSEIAEEQPLAIRVREGRRSDGRLVVEEKTTRSTHDQPCAGTARKALSALRTRMTRIQKDEPFSRVQLLERVLYLGEAK